MHEGHVAGHEQVMDTTKTAAEPVAIPARQVVAGMVLADGRRATSGYRAYKAGTGYGSVGLDGSRTKVFCAEVVEIDPSRTALTWHRDAQGLWAADHEHHYYVRLTPGGSYRATYCPTVEIGGERYADVAKPMSPIDLADSQQMAKQVAECFAREPWKTESSLTRQTRAVTKAYDS